MSFPLLVRLQHFEMDLRMFTSPSEDLDITENKSEDDEMP